MEDVQRQLKAACALVEGGATVGTGYLVAPDVVATCEHVVPGARGGERVRVRFGYPGPEVACEARVARTDAVADCAVLVLEAPLEGRAPLALSAAPVAPRSPWFTFGYPQVARADGVSFAGVVDDPDGRKDGRPALVLTSEKVAAGMATRVHGLSGSPVVVGRAVVGHVASVRPDPDFPERPAFGEVFAAPIDGVLRLLEAIGRRPVATAAPVPAAAAVAPASPPDPAYAALATHRADDARSALASSQALISIGEPRAALELLAGVDDGVRARQLRALALAKCGRRAEAVAELEPLVESGELDAETGGIIGGRYKELWLDERDPNHLFRSFRAYRIAFDRSGELYPGVNALATALYLRRDAPARLGPRDEQALAAIAAAVRTRSAEIAEDDPDPWRLATRAEVLLLDRDLEGARRFYELAACARPEARQDIAVMRRQARRNLAYLGLPEGSLDDALQLPAVVAFTGHMTDAPGRPAPRLPEAKVGALRAAVRTLLDRDRVGFGFGSGARGSDLVFAEEVLARGGRVKVFLPFPAEAFRKSSVETPGDPRWAVHFDELLARGRTDRRVEVLVLEDAVPAEADRPRAYAACNLAIQNAAIEKAGLLDARPRLVAVWDGRPGDGAGGTADAVRDWRDRGIGEVDVIDPATL